MNSDEFRSPANVDPERQSRGTPLGWSGEGTFKAFSLRGGLSWPARIAIVAAGVLIGVVMLIILVPLAIFGVVAGAGLWLWATITAALRPRSEAGRVNVRVMRPGGGE